MDLTKIPRIVIPDSIKPYIPLLVGLLPETVAIKGRMIQFRTTLLKALSDGDIDSEDLLAFILAYAGAPTAPIVLPPDVLPIPAPPFPPAPPTPPSPPSPPAPPADEVTWPHSIKIDLDLFLDGGTDCPYLLEELPDYYRVVKTDGTDNLPIRGGAYLHALYRDAAGKEITFPPGSPLDHTAVWVASRVGDDSGGVWCGPGNPAKHGGSRKIANFRLAEYERTRGMDVPIHFPPEADETVVQVVVYVDRPDGRRAVAKPVWFPKVS